MIVDFKTIYYIPFLSVFRTICRIHTKILSFTISIEITKQLVAITHSPCPMFTKLILFFINISRFAFNNKIWLAIIIAYKNITVSRVCTSIISSLQLDMLRKITTLKQLGNTNKYNITFFLIIFLRCISICLYTIRINEFTRIKVIFQIKAFIS